MGTEDDTYAVLVGKEVTGQLSAVTYTTTNQTVYFYEYEVDGVAKKYCLTEPPSKGRHNVKAIVSPSGWVKFL